MSESVFVASSSRNIASLLSMLINSICCITHITSEKRLTAVSNAKIFTDGTRSEIAANTPPFTTQQVLSSSASTNTSKVILFITHEAESMQISPGVEAIKRYLLALVEKHIQTQTA